MDEEKLNISIRRFLKNVGITSQRVIEMKVREKIKSGDIKDLKQLKINANISSEKLELNEDIEGEIELQKVEDKAKTTNENTFKFCENNFKSLKEEILCSQDDLHKSMEENSVGFVVFYVVAVIFVALLFQLSTKDFSNKGKKNKQYNNHLANIDGTSLFAIFCRVRYF